MMSSALRRPALVLALLASAGPLPAQGVPSDPAQGLAAAGEAARSAWMAGDFARLVAGGARIQLRLPGADPSAGVGQAQAVALLRGYVQGTTEVQVTVVSAREVGPDRAFVDLRRRYRLDGTQEERVESVLLGYRRAGGGWLLVDLRVDSAP